MPPCPAGCDTLHTNLLLHGDSDLIGHRFVSLFVVAQFDQRRALLVVYFLVTHLVKRHMCWRIPAKLCLATRRGFFDAIDVHNEHMKYVVRLSLPDLAVGCGVVSRLTGAEMVCKVLAVPRNAVSTSDSFGVVAGWETFSPEKLDEAEHTIDPTNLHQRHCVLTKYWISLTPNNTKTIEPKSTQQLKNLEVAGTNGGVQLLEMEYGHMEIINFQTPFLLRERRSGHTLSGTSYDNGFPLGPARAGRPTERHLRCRAGCRRRCTDGSRRRCLCPSCPGRSFRIPGDARSSTGSGSRDR